MFLLSNKFPLITTINPLLLSILCLTGLMVYYYGRLSLMG